MASVASVYCKKPATLAFAAYRNGHRTATVDIRYTIRYAESSTLTTRLRSHPHAYILYINVSVNVSSRFIQCITAKKPTDAQASCGKKKLTAISLLRTGAVATQRGGLNDVIVE